MEDNQATSYTGRPWGTYSAEAHPWLFWMESTAKQDPLCGMYSIERTTDTYPVVKKLSHAMEKPVQSISYRLIVLLNI